MMAYSDDQSGFHDVHAWPIGMPGREASPARLLYASDWPSVTRAHFCHGNGPLNSKSRMTEGVHLVLIRP